MRYESVHGTRGRRGLRGAAGAERSGGGTRPSRRRRRLGYAAGSSRWSTTTAFVAVGGKAEAAIDLSEFPDSATGDVTLQVGDEIEATVVDEGTRSGSIKLKRVAGRGRHVPGEPARASRRERARGGRPRVLPVR